MQAKAPTLYESGGAAKPDAMLSAASFLLSITRVGEWNGSSVYTMLDIIDIWDGDVSI